MPKHLKSKTSIQFKPNILILLITLIIFWNLTIQLVKSVIGKGGTSSVKLVSKNEQFAMKALKNSDYKEMKRFIGEGETMFILRHLCVLDIIAVNYGFDKNQLSLIPSLEPTSLELAIENKKKLEDIDKCRITVEIALGMRYIHCINFMDRDLKPSNILPSKVCHVHISDSGIAKEESLETSQAKGVGTLRFMTTELLASDEDDCAHYTNKIDVYSFSVTLVYIVTVNFPKFNMKNVVNGVLPPLPSTIMY